MPNPIRVTTFPMESLPEPIGRFSISCAASLSAPAELVAIPALVVAAAAIGNSRAIRLKSDWTEPASLFAAVVSPSGTMKSPALNLAAKPLQDLNSPERRTWTADVTVEQLARLLAANPRGLLQVRDELSAWVRAMNQYRQGRGADRQFYLSVWNGASVMVDRVGTATGTGTSTSITAARPCLSVVGCLPPDVVHELEDAGQEDGFLPRLLFAWPDPVSVRWTDTVVPLEIRQAYANRIKELFDIPMGNEPVSLALTSEAQARFIQWHDQHCSQTEDKSLPPFLRGVYAKLKGYGPRLALVHAVVSNPSAANVERGSVDAAIVLVEYFKTQAWRVMPLIGQRRTNAVDRCKEEIRRKLSVCRSMKRRELQKNSAFDAEVFNQALCELRSPGIIEDEDGILHVCEPTNRQVVAPRPQAAGV